MTSRSFLVALMIVCSMGSARADLRDLLNRRDVRHFKFSGTVTESLPMASAGTKVSGTFSYELSAETVNNYGPRFGPGYGFAAYQFPLLFTMKVNGHTLSSTNTSVKVTNNFGGNAEDAIDISAGYPLVLDGTTFNEGVMALGLASGPGRKLVLLSTDLPRWIFPKLFNAWAYGVVRQGGGPSDTLLTFSIDSIESTP